MAEKILLPLDMKFYIDTSVWGGYFDEEFKEWTVPFIEQVRTGKCTGVISNITLAEIATAPVKVRKLLESIDVAYLEFIQMNDEQETLAKRYIQDGALTKKFYSDAQHIAIATIIKADSLASWNFRHMVNFFRIRQYNGINLKHGYSTIDIRTPKELLL